MNEFKRKQWTRIGLSLIAVIVAALFLTGIIGGKPMTYRLVDVRSETEKGFGGDVTVNVGLKGNTVRTLTIDTPDETEGLGKKASGEEFTSQFIEKEGPFKFGENGIEAISGATVTSKAALKALNRAITGEDAEEEPAEEPAKEEAPAEEQKQEEAAEEYAYTSEKETNFSIIRVSANAADGKITACSITSEAKMEGSDFLTDEIRAAWANAIVESGNADTDAITGATLQFSAGAVKEAIADILAQAGGAAEEPAPAEEPAKEETAKEEAPEEEQKQEETPAEEPVAEETVREEAPAEDYAYTAEKETNFSTIRVSANAENGKITACKITSEAKSEGSDFLTDEIRGAWADAIAETGNADTDVITGATLQFSAGAVKEAIADILAQAGGAAEEPAPAEEPAKEEAPAEEPKQEAAAEEYAYAAEKETNFSIIRVSANAENGKITACKITSVAKMEGSDFLTDEIRTAWANAIVESGNADTDAITGATLQFSAGAVKEAVADILAQAGGAAEEPAPAEEPAKEETPAEPAAENPAPLPAAVAQGIVVSMGSDQANNIVTSYLEQDPYLVNIYEGYGFAKDYGSARGHYYTLEDVQKTQRPHPKAYCITCKTGDFAKMVNTEGIEVYSRPFDEVMASMKQGINCYTCHGEGNGMDGKASVSHSYVNTALGENVSGIAPATLACGQCHIEYYFTPSDSETMMPYGSVAEMTPEAILAYYDAMDFADWTQESTGTRLLKAQHPEMETVLQGVHASMGLTCADCHMPTETTDDGISYRSHYIQSPMQNDLLLQSCVRCHGSVENVNTLVAGIQGKVTARETEVGNKLSAMKDALAAAVQKGSMSGEELDAVRKLHREAQWYFDFCYVENSEGAHNSKLSLSCLETAEGKIAEAMTLLGQE